MRPVLDEDKVSEKFKWKIQDLDVQINTNFVEPMKGDV